MKRQNRQKKRNKNNYANRFTAILIIAVLVNICLYWFPEKFAGINIKKVDLLADIRESLEYDENEKLNRMFAETTQKTSVDKINIKDDNPNINLPDVDALPAPSPLEEKTTEKSEINESPKKKSMPHRQEIDDPDYHYSQQNTDENSSNLLKTDKLTQITKEVISNDDKYRTEEIFSKTQIEDFSASHTSLRHFFAALNNRNNLGRPVRIAFVGDSFIEGDILVADFRAKMQARFGGRGVGFIPVRSNVAQYRPTIKQSADGWQTYSIIKNRRQKYMLSGLVFAPTSSTASIHFQTVDMYPGLEEVSSLKFIYSKNTATDMILKNNEMELSETYELPATESISQYEINGIFTSGTLQFRNAEGLKAYGIALEDNRGVIVDNFSLRGNSGLVMSSLDAESCRELQEIRPYDLIVLQYGLNVASDSIREYGWYRSKMVGVVEHLKYCFPGADILILGVSDRSRKRGGQYSTMPSVLSLLRAQRQTAEETEVAFWSIFAAMGGQNSMVKYVKSNWASKDYTHMSFRGGREIANALYDALITEKGMYDNDEKLVER